MDDGNREEVHIGRGPRVRIETAWLVAVVAIIAVVALAGLVTVMAFDSDNKLEPNPASAPGSDSTTPTPTPTVIEKVVVVVATPTPGPTPTPIVVIKEVPVVREVIKEVVVTPTPGPTSTPIIVERVIEKVVVATPTPPAASQLPASYSTSGAVPDEIPGMKLPLGSQRTASVDKNIKPRDVYAIELIAGQQVQIEITQAGWVSFILAYPGSTSFRTGEYKRASDGGVYGSAHIPFVAPVDGTYYLSVHSTEGASGSNRYTIAIALSRQ